MFLQTEVRISNFEQSNLMTKSEWEINNKQQEEDDDDEEECCFAVH